MKSPTRSGVTFAQCLVVAIDSPAFVEHAFRLMPGHYYRPPATVIERMIDDAVMAAEQQAAEMARSFGAMASFTFRFVWSTLPILENEETDALREHDRQLFEVFSEKHPRIFEEQK